VTAKPLTDTGAVLLFCDLVMCLVGRRAMVGSVGCFDRKQDRGGGGGSLLLLMGI
jgi:hypothetical protein